MRKQNVIPILLYKCEVRAGLNPLVKNGLSHPYQLDESIFIFRGVKSIFFIFISFFDEFPVSKQNSPRWDGAFYGVTPGAIMFVYVP